MPDRTDDSSIKDEDPLWRRILSSWVHRNPDGTVRPSSVAFLDRLSGEVSVHLARLTNVERVLAGHETDSLAEIQARVPRSLGHAIVRDPEPADPSHALICAPRDRGINKRKRDAHEMAVRSRWVVEPVP